MVAVEDQPDRVDQRAVEVEQHGPEPAGAGEVGVWDGSKIVEERSKVSRRESKGAAINALRLTSTRFDPLRPVSNEHHPHDSRPERRPTPGPASASPPAGPPALQPGSLRRARLRQHRSPAVWPRRRKAMPRSARASAVLVAPPDRISRNALNPPEATRTGALDRADPPESAGGAEQRGADLALDGREHPGDAGGIRGRGCPPAGTIEDQHRRRCDRRSSASPARPVPARTRQTDLRHRAAAPRRRGPLQDPRHHRGRRCEDGAAKRDVSRFRHVHTGSGEGPRPIRAGSGRFRASRASSRSRDSSPGGGSSVTISTPWCERAEPHRATRALIESHRRPGQIVVHDALGPLEVEPFGGDIGRDENARPELVLGARGVRTIGAPRAAPAAPDRSRAAARNPGDARRRRRECAGAGPPWRAPR